MEAWRLRRKQLVPDFGCGGQGQYTGGALARIAGGDSALRERDRSDLGTELEPEPAGPVPRRNAEFAVGGAQCGEILRSASGSVGHEAPPDSSAVMPRESGLSSNPQPL